MAKMVKYQDHPVLNVAEKPNVAEFASRILSSMSKSVINRRRDLCEFPFDFQTASHQEIKTRLMIFTSVIGHLMNFEFKRDAHRKWSTAADLYDCVKTPVDKFVIEESAHIAEKLKEEAKKCSVLVLWLDNSKEGHNIASEVASVCKSANPDIEVLRACFSALTEREIFKAVKTLQPFNNKVANAVDIRREVDFRAGRALTRFQTQYLKSVFQIDFDDSISYGSCLLPALGFVVERQRKNEQHEAKVYRFSFEDERNGTRVKFKSKAFDETNMKRVREAVLNADIATVIKFEERLVLKNPPQPLSTLELLKLSTMHCNMSSAQAMEAAQKLYSDGFISYPRTNATSFSEIDLHPSVEELKRNKRFVKYAQSLLDSEENLWRYPSSGEHDTAHPPIYPTTKPFEYANSKEDHRKIYDLIARHFLACVSKPARSIETHVVVKIAGVRFFASGRKIHAENNYLEIYPFDKWEASEIPTYCLEEMLQLSQKVNCLEENTNPEPLLKEADLLSCMAENGIGTAATMHIHIKSLFKYYATKNYEGFISPTNLGLALVEGYENMSCSSLYGPELHIAVEKGMKEFISGDESKSEVLNKVLQMVKTWSDKAKSSTKELAAAMDKYHFVRRKTVCPCPRCGQFELVLKSWKTPAPESTTQFFIGCVNFPYCMSTYWFPRYVTAATIEQPCIDCINSNRGVANKVRYEIGTLEMQGCLRDHGNNTRLPVTYSAGHVPGGVH